MSEEQIIRAILYLLIPIIVGISIFVKRIRSENKHIGNMKKRVGMDNKPVNNMPLKDLIQSFTGDLDKLRQAQGKPKAKKKSGCFGWFVLIVWLILFSAGALESLFSNL